jgi:hypothetical protein
MSVRLFPLAFGFLGVFFFLGAIRWSVRSLGRLVSAPALGEKRSRMTSRQSALAYQSCLCSRNSFARNRGPR